MTVISGQSIRKMGMITPFSGRREFLCGDIKLSGGLGPAGYDLHLDWGKSEESWLLQPGEFRLAATQEHFVIPDNVIATVYDKSTWARQGLSLFNTVCEPGWRGYLTLELKNLGDRELFMPQGVPIAHVLFQYLDEPTEMSYSGKYQDQPPGPQPAI